VGCVRVFCVYRKLHACNTQLFFTSNKPFWPATSTIPCRSFTDEIVRNCCLTLTSIHDGSRKGAWGWSKPVCTHNFWMILYHSLRYDTLMSLKIRDVYARSSDVKSASWEPDAMMMLATWRECHDHGIHAPDHRWSCGRSRNTLIDAGRSSARHFAKCTPFFEDTFLSDHTRVKVYWHHVFCAWKADASNAGRIRVVAYRDMMLLTDEYW
jgi:hypothetical protein